VPPIPSRIRAVAVVRIRSPAVVGPQIAAFGPAQVLQGLAELLNSGSGARVSFGVWPYDANPPHSVGLLRPRHQRHTRCAAEEVMMMNAPGRGDVVTSAFV
jgi:hypothetical protein